MVRVHTMLTQEGAAKTEREETEDRTLTSRELREETRAIKTLFKGAENNPETVEKIKALVQKSLPKMKKLFGSLEKARRLAEDQQRKEAKAFEDFEKYILEDLVK
ncbi:hypothetical protein KY362_06410, partial [Candidatus Woesearchaeota archaeon]|nr:hypothetical protein [Candidatus Woesearchaeota archaeon]